MIYFLFVFMFSKPSAEGFLAFSGMQFTAPYALEGQTVHERMRVFMC